MAKARKDNEMGKKTQVVHGVDRYIGISYFELHNWLEHHLNNLHTPPDKIIELVLKWSETEDEKEVEA